MHLSCRAVVPGQADEYVELYQTETTCWRYAAEGPEREVWCKYVESVCASARAAQKGVSLGPG